MLLSSFHPLIERWFSTRLGQPTAAQLDGWRQIAGGRDTLIAAPTGSGKTLAAFLFALDELVLRASHGGLEDETAVVYVSPLKALGNDIQKNLQQPLAEISALAAEQGILLPEIRVMVRSGDTPASERQSMTRRPPHILITTPESLYILLTAERSRQMLKTARTLILDEIHAVAQDKRGAHLALSLERLDALAHRRLQRIGLSATQKPIEDVARLLVGTDRLILGNIPDCAIVDVGHKRTLDLSVEVGDHELGPIASHELYDDIYDRIVELSRQHRSTIVFVNTRRLVERVAHQLSQRLGEEKVAAHHGSMSRVLRLRAEEGLKNGSIPVVVATASLELGIDVGHVDLVCHLGSARSIATLLQRVGRSGHWLGAVPKGILFPLTRDDLLQSAALVRAVGQGELDRLILPENPLDILSQQIVATVAAGEIGEEELWQLVRRAFPFRNLSRRDFDAVIGMLSEGIASRRGRRSAHLHRDEVNGRLRPRRGARLAAITGGGAIPDTADYDVIEEPTDTFVGRVNEDFAIESMAGDIFLLGNRSWRIKRVEAGRMRVQDAQGAPPSIPFWLGESPARTQELSAAVGELREDVARALSAGASSDESDSANTPATERERSLVAWLIEQCRVDRSGAEQIVTYIAATLASLGSVPTQTRVIAERFFDEAGGMQLVLHAPFGGRINRAWGLALRKCFCRTFDFELQAAATDDGIVLSLGEQHSFPLESVFEFVRPANVEKALMQAALVSPMFTNRWRWNAQRSLALLRHAGGKRIPVAIQRMRAEDLLAAVFPAQLACGDNHPRGEIEPPDHPLVNETVGNCLHEAMDLDGLKALLEQIVGGGVEVRAVDTPAPSPMSHEILNANPYAFLDDAPLEERRARAVSLRRVDPELAGGIGALDPEAIAAVRMQAWPDVRDADELHDLLLGVIALPVELLAAPPFPRSLAESVERSESRWETFADELLAQRRAVVARVEEAGEAGGRSVRQMLVAVERAAHAQLALPDAVLEPVASLARSKPAEVSAEDAVRTMVQGWLECLGPTTASSLASLLGLKPSRVEQALLQLEAEGIVLRGQFETKAAPGSDGTLPLEWCERRLLARIHRLTVGRLRKEIEAVSAADFLRFLLRWQHVQPGTQLHGRDGVRAVIARLQGLELPAPAWESEILPSRVSLYSSSDLEQLCLAGEVAWARLRLPGAVAELEASGRSRRRTAPTRSAPLAFALREALPRLLEPSDSPQDLVSHLSPAAAQVYAWLQRYGASFLPDIARGTGKLPTQAEEALWELVACGLVTGDGIAGLRVLLLPELKRREPRRHLRGLNGGLAAKRLMPLGRWSILHRQTAGEGNDGTGGSTDAGALGGRLMAEAGVVPWTAPAEWFARQLLQRYGVILRELLAREVRAPSWRELVAVYRRLEARGEIRGGRFVAGFVGEQFALPEAVEALRAVRRLPEEHDVVMVSAADPLNLVGILTPGARLSPFVNQTIAYRNGVPVAVGEIGAVLSQLQLPRRVKS